MPTPWDKMTEEQKARHRETYRRYYARNREKAIARVKSYYEKHRDQRIAYSKKWAAEHADHKAKYMRDYRQSPIGRLLASYHNRTTKYGLSREQLDTLVANQNGQCAICHVALTIQGKNGMHVDHDPATTKIRGLLCGRCNIGIGQFRHDPKLLLDAAGYLENH
jgi:hypothetical protein